GVSRMATNNEAPGWKELIERGLHICDRMGADSAMVNSCRSLLDSPKPSYWLKAADEVQELLGGPDSGDYRLFLKTSVGDLRVTDHAILDAVQAVHRSGNCIATTNYDDILRRRLLCDAIPWTKPDMFAERLEGKCEGVLHLHGWWQEGPSVI